MKDEMISTQEAAELLGMHRSSVARLVQQGKIEGERIGRSWVVYKRSVVEFLERFGDLPKTSPKRGN